MASGEFPKAVVRLFPFKAPPAYLTPAWIGITGPALAVGCVGAAGTWAAGFTDTAPLVVLLRARLLRVGLVLSPHSHQP